VHTSFFGSLAGRMVALLLAATALSCGGSGSSGVTDPPPPVLSGNTMNLMVINNHFSPATDSVPAGSTLKWTWNTCTGDGYGGSSCGSHSVQFDDAGPSSEIQSSGTFSRTFDVAGSYTYHCAVHGTAMAGTIVVQ
jgi:plastocyanin